MQNSTPAAEAVNLHKYLHHLCPDGPFLWHSVSPQNTQVITNWPTRPAQWHLSICITCSSIHSLVDVRMCTSLCPFCWFIGFVWSIHPFASSTCIHISIDKDILLDKVFENVTTWIYRSTSIHSNYIQTSWDSWSMHTYLTQKSQPWVTEAYPLQGLSGRRLIWWSFTEEHQFLQPDGKAGWSSSYHEAESSRNQLSIYHDIRTSCGNPAEAMIVTGFLMNPEHVPPELLASPLNWCFGWLVAIHCGQTFGAQHNCWYWTIIKHYWISSKWSWIGMERYLPLLWPWFTINQPLTVSYITMNYCNPNDQWLNISHDQHVSWLCDVQLLIDILSAILTIHMRVYQ